MITFRERDTITVLYLMFFLSKYLSQAILRSHFSDTSYQPLHVSSCVPCFVAQISALFPVPWYQRFTKQSINKLHN